MTDVVIFQVPILGVAPSDAMIDWLGGFDGWEGDDSGIVILGAGPDDEPTVIWPGEYITVVDGKLAKHKNLDSLPLLVDADGKVVFTS